MMVTGTRGVMRMLGSNGGDIPKALMTSVKCSKKSRRCKKRAEPSKHPDPAPPVFPPPPLRTNDEEPGVPLSVETKFIPSSFIVPRVANENDRFSTRAIFHEKLYSLLTQEGLMHADTSHLYRVNAESDDKVDASLRQETLSKLWCLHSAFYSLSTSVFCKAVCLMDSFISRVKVKPKYAMCVAAACYYIASKFERSQDVLLPTPDSLVTLTRCGGTATDLTRMVEIILSKLSPPNVAAIGACSATASEFLLTFASSGLWDAADSVEDAALWSASSTAPPPPPRLSNTFYRQLEVSLTSAEAASFRPSCLALALLSLYCLPVSQPPTDAPGLGLTEELHFSVPDLFNLAQLCGIHWADVDACRLAIKNAVLIPTGSNDIQDYPASRLLGSSPPLVWTLSRRTQRIMSTSQAPTLPTIAEADERLDNVQSALEKLTLHPDVGSVAETLAPNQL